MTMNAKDTNERRRLDRRLLLFLLLLVGPLACRDNHRAGGEPAAGSATVAPSARAPTAAVEAIISVTKAGFLPAEVTLEQGRPGTLVFTRTEESRCLNAVLMPWTDTKFALPINKPVRIQVDTSKAGTFRYSCWMGMVFGGVTIKPTP